VGKAAWQARSYLKIGEKDRGNRQGETIWALKDINFQYQWCSEWNTTRLLDSAGLSQRLQKGE